MSNPKNGIVDQPTEITTIELRAAFDVALKDLEKMGVSKIITTDDYYWKVPIESRYNLKNEPPELNCGQLFDDVNWLKELLRSGEGTYTALLFLSGIIDYIPSRSLTELTQ